MRQHPSEEGSHLGGSQSVFWRVVVLCETHVDEQRLIEGMKGGLILRVEVSESFR